MEATHSVSIDLLVFGRLGSRSGLLRTSYFVKSVGSTLHRVWIT